MKLGHCIAFPPFHLDMVEERLRCGAQGIFLRRKTFVLLRYLVEHPGQLITKADLLRAVWPDTHVSEGVLTVCITELRKALGDDAKAPQFIETAHRRGYRFIREVVSSQHSGVSRPASPSLAPSPHPGGPRSRTLATASLARQGPARRATNCLRDG
jgi:DNA-binding winged helix-turn-helix (wHTH) protein